jgi:hypothetical protein
MTSCFTRQNPAQRQTQRQTLGVIFALIPSAKRSESFLRSFHQRQTLGVIFAGSFLRSFFVLSAEILQQIRNASEQGETVFPCEGVSHGTKTAMV